eukprot:CAMPEP_0114410646 /NCGR_PEP_ID=MMETSP0102-20121206/24182_1 /TAXON_ID=38822 ORGANISM="Pteridomonas danica, Strain PT" /NCGR_SAMPLE_ID=MMETSP0102 /ASSEMBLY_ACC=CAM_ASM_000212 /LENGTH=87 /DNA_ID=CAMNT_0001578385 /DNA_START=102 /DNA_END=365 /DNA_ORIENTATION=+
MSHLNCCCCLKWASKEELFDGWEEQEEEEGLDDWEEEIDWRDEFVVVGDDVEEDDVEGVMDESVTEEGGQMEGSDQNVGVVFAIVGD